MRKSFLLFYPIILAFLFACSDTSAGLGKKEGLKSKDSEVVFKIANGAEIVSLDPARVAGVPGYRVMSALSEGLVVYDPVTAGVALGVIKSMPAISKDGLVYTFELRTDLKWSDGERLTAHDFVYGFKRLLDPKTAAEYANMFYPIAGARAFNEGKVSADEVQIMAVDDYTLKVTLENPTAYILSAMCHFAFLPIPRHTIEKYGDEWIKDGNHVGNGPYKLKKWAQNSSLEVVKNPHYYDIEKVKLDRIIFYPTDDYTTAYNMFKQGEVDWNTGIYPAAMIDEVYARSDAQVSPIFADIRFVFNLTKEHFKDLRVRKALVLSLDTEDLVKNILRNGSIVTGSLVPPMKGTDYEPIIKKDTFNPEWAKKLLAEAGYPDGKGFPKVSFYYNTGDRNRLTAEWAQSQWKKHLGIDIPLRNEEWKVFLANRMSQKFDIARSAWYADFKDPFTFLDLYLSYSPMNDSKYNNPRYDGLLEKAAKLPYGKERFKVLRQAEEILLEDYPFIPLYVQASINLIDTEKWGGWSSNILDFHPPKGIYLKKGK